MPPDTTHLTSNVHRPNGLGSAAGWDDPNGWARRRHEAAVPDVGLSRAVAASRSPDGPLQLLDRIRSSGPPRVVPSCTTPPSAVSLGRLFGVAGVHEARLKGHVRPGAGFAAALPLRGVTPGRPLYFGNRGDPDEADGQQARSPTPLVPSQGARLAARPAGRVRRSPRAAALPDRRRRGPGLANIAGGAAVELRPTVPNRDQPWPRQARAIGLHD